MINVFLLALTGIRSRSAKDTLDAMREGWANSPALPWLLATMALLLAGVLMAAYVYNRRQNEAAEVSPLKLFDELAAELAIPPADRRLLARISRQQKLPTPLTLLLSPRTMRYHAAAFWQSTRAWRRVRIAKRIATLRRKLCASEG